MLFLFSCSSEITGFKIPLPRLEKEEITLPIKKFPEPICRIIDELELCEYMHCETKECCYDSEQFVDFYPIKENDSTWEYFLVRTPGGSGGDGVSVYKKESEKYVQVQDEFVFFDTVLSDVTNGFYDIRLWHRDYSRGYIHVLYQWNGKKYEPAEVIDINGIPMEMFSAMKIAKPELNSEYFVKEFEGVSDAVYFELVIDTLFHGYDESIYSVVIPDWQKTKVDKCWIVKQTGDQFVLSVVAGTSTQTYVQDELGKRDYKSIVR